MTPDDIDYLLRSCCGTEASRYQNDRPFLFGDYVCATDGRVCVRVPRGMVASESYGATNINLTVLDWDSDRPERFALPGLPPAKILECENCQGSGGCVCRCSHEHDCTQCDGRGHFELSSYVAFPRDDGTTTYLDARYARRFALCEWKLGASNVARVDIADGIAALVATSQPYGHEIEDDRFVATAERIKEGQAMNKGPYLRRNFDGI